MKPLLLAALIATLASSLPAQPHVADSSGIYLGLTSARFSNYGSYGLGGTLGYQQSNRFDYGIAAQAEGWSPSVSRFDHSEVSVGA